MDSNLFKLHTPRAQCGATMLSMSLSHAHIVFLAKNLGWLPRKDHGQQVDRSTCCYLDTQVPLNSPQFPLQVSHLQKLRSTVHTSMQHQCCAPVARPNDAHMCT